MWAVSGIEGGLHSALYWGVGSAVCGGEIADLDDERGLSVVFDGEGRERVGQQEIDGMKRDWAGGCEGLGGLMGVKYGKGLEARLGYADVYKSHTTRKIEGRNCLHYFHNQLNQMQTVRLLQTLRIQSR